MLTLSNLTKCYGGRTLFEEVTFQVTRGERMGLVGPNGAGKSTLFQIILGLNSPDSGDVVRERGARIGYLPQESLPVQHETVLELATATRLDFRASDSSGEIEDHDLHHEEDYSQVVKAKRILAGLSFREKDFDRPARELSGGWIMRAHLARLLVQEPDLLMLDEPTNHLDLDSLIWLREYLKNYPGALLMISHDRDFLNQLVHGIVEIRLSRLFKFKGNYDEYLVQKEAVEEQQMAAFKNQQREIERLMLFVDRFRAKNTKAAQAQSKLKQIDRMEKLSAPESDNKAISFSFPQPERSGLRVIRLLDIHQSYGANVVYQGMEFSAERGQRIVLVGPNGAGKSTLLKILAGVVEPQRGTRELGHNVRSGYFAQHRVEMLQANRTVFEEAMDTPQRVTEEYIRTVLGCFLFSGDDAFKPVRVLSGGEKTRLALVKLLLDPPNLLLMDEPTTHLDIASINALIYALDQYEGTLIFISHDVHFIRSVAEHVIHVQHGVLRHYPGGYDYYLGKKAAENTAQNARQNWNTGGAKPADDKDRDKDRDKSAGKSKEDRRRRAEEVQARGKVKRALKDRVTALEKEISELEKRQQDLTEELQKPEVHALPGGSADISLELGEITPKLAELHTRWETAATELAAMDQEKE